MKLLIIRHGDPDYKNDTLTAAGWNEAKRLAGRLDSITAVYTSPLGRARDTAAFTLEKLHMKAETLDWLQEFPVHMYDPEIDRIRVIWDWLPQVWTADPSYYDRYAWCHTPVMEEAGAPAAYEKVCTGLDLLLAKHGYVRDGEIYRAAHPNRDTIALFCHFGLECVLLSHLLGVSPMPLWHGTCAAPTSVTTVVTEERREGIASFRMTGFGDTSHLEEVSFSARFCETFDCEEERHD